MKKTISRIISILFIVMMLLSNTAFGSEPMPVDNASIEDVSVSIADHSAGAPAKTKNYYKGYVTLEVGGYGQAAGEAYSDALYIFANSAQEDVDPMMIDPFYLCINNEPIKKYMVSIPPYNPGHKYKVQVYLEDPGQLDFYTCDTYQIDNSGHFLVSVLDGTIVSPPVPPVEETCTDSDGGRNYYMKGSVTVCTSSTFPGGGSGGCGGSDDRCLSDTTLQEGSCSGAVHETEKYSCPNGCKDGACVKTDVSDDQCSADSDCGMYFSHCSCTWQCRSNKAVYEPESYDCERECPNESSPSDVVCGCSSGACVLKNTDQKCKGEGELVNPFWNPGMQCCEDLDIIYAMPGVVDGDNICYDPAKGKPVCSYESTKSEGWYYPDGELLRYIKCSRFSSTCGNSVCEKGETQDSCPSDCSPQICPAYDIIPGAEDKCLASGGRWVEGEYKDGCPLGPRCVTSDDNDDFDELEVLSVIMKLESMKIKIDKMLLTAHGLAKYYESIGDSKTAHKWSLAAEAFDDLSDYLESAKERVKNHPKEDLKAYLSDVISTMKSKLKSIIDIILGSNYDIPKIDPVDTVDSVEIPTVDVQPSLITTSAANIADATA